MPRTRDLLIKEMKNSYKNVSDYSSEDAETDPGC